MAVICLQEIKRKLSCGDEHDSGKQSGFSLQGKSPGNEVDIPAMAIHLKDNENSSIALPNNKAPFIWSTVTREIKRKLSCGDEHDSGKQSGFSLQGKSPGNEVDIPAMAIHLKDNENSSIALPNNKAPFIWSTVTRGKQPR